MQLSATLLQLTFWAQKIFQKDFNFKILLDYDILADFNPKELQRGTSFDTHVCQARLSLLQPSHLQCWCFAITAHKLTVRLFLATMRLRASLAWSLEKKFFREKETIMSDCPLYCRAVHNEL